VNDIFNFHPLVNLLHMSLFLPKWYKILQPPTTQMQHHCPSSTSNLPHTSSISNKSFETYGLVLCNEGNCLGNCKDRHLLYIYNLKSIVHYSQRLPMHSWEILQHFRAISSYFSFIACDFDFKILVEWAKNSFR
jgi:hypothetical protein